jgi:competence protein ComEC
MRWLKVGHHGSKNSTTPDFLAAVQLRVAIISAGAANPYGHPSRELHDRLDAAPVRTLRTDRDGAVHVLTDSHTLDITCFVACRETPTQQALGQSQAPGHEQKSQQQ